MDTFRGTAKVATPVPCKFAVSQLSRGGMHANENESAMTKNTYRTLNDSGGSAPENRTRQRFCYVTIRPWT